MKILYIAPCAAHQLEYVNSFYREMHDVTVLTDNLSFHTRRLIKPNFEYSFNKITGPFFLGILRKLIYKYPLPNQLLILIDYLINKSLEKNLKRLKNKKYDFVISYKDMGLKYINDFKKNGALWIIDEVNTHPDFFEFYLSKEKRRLGIKGNIFFSLKKRESIKSAYEISDAILVPSRHVYRILKKRTLKNKKFIINPYGCPFPIIKKFDINSETINLICVARIHYRKGIRYLLKAFQLLDKKFPGKYKLKIIGSESSTKGFDNNLKSENLMFLGEKNKEVIKNLFKNSHIFILPSLEEGQALVIGEALAHGLPVISTPLSGALDYIVGEQLFNSSRKNLSIQIINPRKIEEFSDAIIKLKDLDIYLKASQGAIEIASQNTWNHSGQKLVRELESFLKNNPETSK